MRFAPWRASHFSTSATSARATPRRRQSGWTEGVAPPAVERADDRTDDLSLDFAHEDAGGACGNGPPQVLGGVGDAGRGFSPPPKFEDRLDIFQPAVPYRRAVQRF